MLDVLRQSQPLRGDASRKAKHLSGLVAPSSLSSWRLIRSPVPNTLLRPQAQGTHSGTLAAALRAGTGPGQTELWADCVEWGQGLFNAGVLGTGAPVRLHLEMGLSGSD